MIVSTYQKPYRQAGFTLIEMVVGIVALGAVLAVLTTLIYPQTKQSVDPVYAVRAAELGQTLLNEISGKKFDENSGVGGALIRCDEGVINCADASTLGPDGASEATIDGFDDVDDYHGYSQSGQLLATNNAFSSLYTGFTVAVSVGYDANFDGVFDDADVKANRSVKLIRLVITTPSNQQIAFATYRGNY